MPSLIFEKCCGFIELKTGCFIIGYLELVGSIIMIILTALGIVGGGVIHHEGKDEAVRAAGLVLMIALSVMLFFILLFLGFVIALLVGLHQAPAIIEVGNTLLIYVYKRTGMPLDNKPGHLKAYLIYAVIFLVVYIIQFFAVVIGGAPSAGGIAQALISILLNAYFILVIRSMYYEMKEAPSRGPAIYSAP